MMNEYLNERMITKGRHPNEKEMKSRRYKTEEVTRIYEKKKKKTKRSCRRKYREREKEREREHQGRQLEAIENRYKYKEI